MTTGHRRSTRQRKGNSQKTSSLLLLRPAKEVVVTVLLVLLCSTAPTTTVVAAASGFASMAGYVPTTNVTVPWYTIDLEQQLIFQQSFPSAAQSVYDQSTIRTLSSVDGNDKRGLNGEFYPYFQWFIDYFGQSSYGDDFTTSAFTGRDTTSGFSGNFAFSYYDATGQAEAAATSTVALSVAGYILRNLDKAVEDCQNTTGSANNNNCTTDTCALYALDAAVAMYVGSLQDSTGTGLLQYATANAQCREFQTCGNYSTGTAQVNRNIMQGFASMQTSLLAGQCADAATSKTAIAKQFFVPFIQGSIRTAYFLNTTTGSQTNNDESMAAQGAVYAAAVLPVVQSCNQKDADLIFKSLRPRSPTATTAVDFAAVVASFQKNYVCIGISCEDVGTLWDANKGQYVPHAGICTHLNIPPPVAPTTPAPSRAPVPAPITVPVPFPAPVPFLPAPVPASTSPGIPDNLGSVSLPPSAAQLVPSLTTPISPNGSVNSGPSSAALPSAGSAPTPTTLSGIVSSAQSRMPGPNAVVVVWKTTLVAIVVSSLLY